MADAVVHIQDVEIRGRVSESGVANFLGIPFATYPARFRQARPVPPHSLPTPFSASEYGTRCPQRPDKPRANRDHLYADVRLSSSIPMSEPDCLNLNIYAPPGITSPLPVFVWIHGGGFTMGDAHSEYDGNFLVQRSIELGKPFVFVAINYRLGYFGFLSSRELEAEAVRNGEVYCANQGLYDQRVGLQWVQNYIHHFGGNASEVTIAGESAGAMSVLCHLASDVPVCKRGMIFSDPMAPFATPDESQATFDRLAAHAGAAASAPAEAKLAAVRGLPAGEIAALLAGPHLLLAEDRRWFVRHHGPGACVEDVDGFPSWVEGVVVGSTRDECALFLMHWRDFSAAELRQMVRDTVADPALADELIRAYGVDAPDREAALRSALRLATECHFTPVPLTLGGRVPASTPVSVYRFEQADTFAESRFHGFSFHALDNVFICRLPAVAGPGAPPQMRATADAVSQACCDFAQGRQPWEAFQTAGRIMVWDGDRTGLVPAPQDEPWRQFAQDPAHGPLLQAAVRRMLRYQRPMQS